MDDNSNLISNANLICLDGGIIDFLKDTDKYYSLFAKEDSLVLNGTVEINRNIILNMDCKKDESVGIMVKNNPENLIEPKEEGFIKSSGANNLILDNNASTINNYYNGWHIRINDQVKKIVNYNSSTKQIILETSLNTSVSINTSYELFDYLYCGMFYDPKTNSFTFGRVLDNDFSTTINTIDTIDTIDIRGRNGYFDGLVEATIISTKSDERLKKDIENLDLKDSVDIIKRLEPKKFNWKNRKNNEKEIGLIAQEVEKILPNIVINSNKDKYKSVSYEKIIPILIGCIKYLLIKVNE